MFQSRTPVEALLQQVFPPMTLAFRCVQASITYRTFTAMAEKSKSVCSKGDTFFGKRLTAQDGSLWLSNESNGLFLPFVHPEMKHQMCEEVRYTAHAHTTALGRPGTPQKSQILLRAG